MKLPDNNLRLIAEIEYKIGLGQMMLNAFDESVTAFRRACEVLDAEIANQKEKDSSSTAADADKKGAAEIAVLEELKGEIVNKITEVEEAKQQSVAEVKEELAKLMSHDPKRATASTAAATACSAGAGSAAAAAAAVPKATNISHLVKRKKPDTPASVSDAAAEGSPAKKPAL